MQAPGSVALEMEAPVDEQPAMLECCIILAGQECASRVAKRIVGRSRLQVVDLIWYSNRLGKPNPPPPPKPWNEGV